MDQQQQIAEMLLARSPSNPAPLAGAQVPTREEQMMNFRPSNIAALEKAIAEARHPVQKQLLLKEYQRLKELGTSLLGPVPGPGIPMTPKGEDFFLPQPLGTAPASPPGPPMPFSDTPGVPADSAEWSRTQMPPAPAAIRSRPAFPWARRP